MHPVSHAPTTRARRDPLRGLPHGREPHPLLAHDRAVRWLRKFCNHERLTVVEADMEGSNFRELDVLVKRC